MRPNGDILKRKKVVEFPKNQVNSPNEFGTTQSQLERRFADA